MSVTDNTYDQIAAKIAALKRDYPFLRSKPDEYVFSVLCIRANYYKNPALTFDEADMQSIVVDGSMASMTAVLTLCCLIQIRKKII